MNLWSPLFCCSLASSNQPEKLKNARSGPTNSDIALVGENAKDNFDGSPQDWNLFHDDYTYLTEIGKAGARKLIKEAMRKDIEWQRKKTRWKLTVAVVIVGLVLGALAILTGLFAFFKRWQHS